MKPINEVGGLRNFIWTIVLNVLDIILMAIGYLAAMYILYGGFLMFFTRGRPAKIAEAQLTIRNAVIGLVLSFGSVAIISFISNGLGSLGDSPSKILASVLGAAYVAAGIAAVIAIIIAGYLYIISDGNASKVEQAKNTITYSVVGLVIIGFAFILTRFIIGSF